MLCNVAFNLAVCYSLRDTKVYEKARGMKIDCGKSGGGRGLSVGDSVNVAEAPCSNGVPEELAKARL